MKSLSSILLLLFFLIACNQNATTNKETGSTTGVEPSSTMSAAKIAMDGELPAKQSIPELFDEMDYQQATQLYLWALPIVSFSAMKDFHENVFGATGNDLVVYNSLEDRLGLLTANATTPYILSFLDLAKSGPMVIEMPAGHSAGGLTDVWQRELTAIGEAGADKGKGGKYILYPPGQKEIKVTGYYTIACPTMNIWFGFRALDPDPKKMEELVHGVKIYPYAQRANPPVTKVLSPSCKKYSGVQPQGMAYWERLNSIFQEEPVEERDRFFAAWLDNLGISKGKPFNPTERQKKILIAGAERGQQMAIANSFDKRFENVKHWPDRQWDYVMIISDPSQRAANYDEFFQRSAYFYEAIGYSKSMITKTPN